MTKDEALLLALEALSVCKTDSWADKELQGKAWEACKEALMSTQCEKQPEQEPLSELEKDAANLLFALHDAWPYVHGSCTIESKKKAIQALMVKHGDFADLQPPATQPAQRPWGKPWVSLTNEEIHDTEGYVETRETYRLCRAIEAKLKEKNGVSSN